MIRRNILDHPMMSISEINSHLCVGPIRCAVADELKRLSITCVINVCTMTLQNIEYEGIKYIHVPLEDTVHENIYDHFDEIADQINAVFEDGGKTVVCCVAGISRSTSFCLAYLMKYHHMSLRDAYFFMKQKRRVVNPNNGFFEQLIRFEERLFNRSSVKMVNVSSDTSEDCVIPDVVRESCRGFVWLRSYKNLIKKRF